MKYKSIILIIILFGFATPFFAQEPITAKLAANDPVLLKDTVPPLFPGGETALYQYLSETIKYPPILIKIKMEGSLSLSFQVNKAGDVKNVNILRGFDPDADDEVLRVMRSMPKWTPASVKSTPVDLNRQITITFTITDALIEESNRPKESVSVRDDSLTVTIPRDTLVQVVEESKVETVVDSLNTDPQFPGGKEALAAYLKAKMKYPKRAIEYQIEGRVLFNIEVSPEGEITKIWLVRGLFLDCNEEAFYLIKKMPKWIPGLKNGVPVAKQVILPIPFILPSNR
jgi:TonB family protein